MDCWFETGDVPKIAKVTVLRDNGTPLFPESGDMKEGIFIFPYDKAEPLKVEISAGQGHHKVLHIPAEMLGTATTDKTPAKQETTETEVPRNRERSTGPDLQSLLIGIGFLLALAAFILSLRNARELRRWKNHLQRSEDRKPEV